MSNIYQIVDMVSSEVLEIAHEKSAFLRTINTQWDSEYDGRIGTALRIRLPDQFTYREDSWAMVPQAQSEQVVTLTHGKVTGCDLEFNHDEIMFALGNDRAFEEISKRKIEPAIAGMISKIESRALTDLTKAVYNLTGTPGSVVGTSGDTSAVGLAQAKVNQGLAPTGDRSFQLDSVTMATVTNGQKSIFHPGDQVSRAFAEGYYGRAYGADWYSNERTYAHLVGSDHTTVTVNDASIASGDSTITTAGGSVTVGTVFTFSGDAVKAVHPETKAAYAHDQQFVITAVNGNDWTFDPPYITTGARQNVSKLPTTGAAITLIGTANLTYAQSLYYHKDAFTFVMAPPPIVDDAHRCMVKRKENMGFRVWMGSDIVNSRLLLRVDAVYGYLAQRPAWACRVTN